MGNGKLFSNRKLANFGELAKDCVAFANSNGHSLFFKNVAEKGVLF